MKKVTVNFDDSLYERMVSLADSENLPVNKYIVSNMEMVVCVSERINSVIHSARQLSDDDYEKARQS